MGNRTFRAGAAWFAAFVLVSSMPVGLALAASEDSPTNAEFYKAQWNLKAIHAHPVFSNNTEAEASGSVLVAVVDTGIDYLHPDLAGRVDLVRSTASLIEYAAEGSKCDGEPGSPYGAVRSGPRGDPFDESAEATRIGRHEVTDFHSHGTGVSGLITSNGRYLAGVTQRTTLFGVKVHGMGRQNCLSVYLAGVRYAADQGADVIHMSFPLEFETDPLKPNAFPEAVTEVNAALDYAHERGAVLVAAAGNNTADLDQGTTFRFCEGNHVVCVSATGPASADAVEEPDWDDSVANTNFGSSIDVAGPGGTTAVPVTLTCSTVTRFSGAPQAPCRAGSFTWQSTGTSFGAAATSGLAALVVRLSGSDDPDVIEQIIEQSADDLGTPGFDDYYGEGRINVKQAAAAALR